MIDLKNTVKLYLVIKMFFTNIKFNNRIKKKFKFLLNEQDNQLFYIKIYVTLVKIVKYYNHFHNFYFTLNIWRSLDIKIKILILYLIIIKFFL